MKSSPEIWMRKRNVAFAVFVVILQYSFLETQAATAPAPTTTAAPAAPETFQDCSKLSNLWKTIPENLTPGTLLFKVKATSLQVTDSPQGYAGYIIAVKDATNSEWEVRQNKSFDAEKFGNGAKSFTLSCADSGTSSIVTPDLNILVDDVNEYAPLFPVHSKEISISESTTAGTEIFTFDTDSMRPDDKDRDASYPDFQIVTGNTTYFKIDPYEGKITLEKEVNYDIGQTLFVLNISAMDPEPANLVDYFELKIKIVDEDDLNPVFTRTSYKLEVDEGTYTGKKHFNTTPPISASDGDSLNTTVEYKIDDSTESLYPGKFSIAQDGSLRFNSRMDIGTYGINIKAYQKDKPKMRYAVAVVELTVVDINDHKPTMSLSTYSKDISEATPVGVILLTVVGQDKDFGKNSEIKFVLNGDTSGTFIMTTNGNSGNLLLNRTLDREVKSRYKLQVVAEESSSQEKYSSSPSDISIDVLDENDNSPVFDKTIYSKQIERTARKGAPVIQVRAKDADDADNGRVSYRIQPSEFTNALSVNNKGKITLTRDLGRGDVGIHEVTLVASDNCREVMLRRSSVSTLTIEVLQVNTNPPIFYVGTETTIVVPETTTADTLIGQFPASDLDDDSITYSIEPGQYDRSFQVNDTDGSLILTNTMDLDRPPVPALLQPISINASDGKFSATLKVTVNFTYVNEYQPFFPNFSADVYVFENSTKGTVITRIQAMDRDKGADGEIRYKIEASEEVKRVFEVDPSSGKISVTCGICLDYDSRNVFEIVAQALDGGSPPKTSMKPMVIHVVETEFSPPKFTKTKFTAEIPENKPAGTFLLKLEATDGDSPQDQLTFGLSTVSASSQATKNIKVSNNGSVYTEAPLDAEATDKLSFEVTVTDSHSQDTAQLEIRVLDENDSPPEFDQLPSVTSVPENAVPGQLLIQIEATDADKTNDGFTFLIEDGDFGDFKLNATTGDLTVAGLLDRRSRVRYNLTILVSDHGSPPKIAQATLGVAVMDSDRPPIFLDAKGRSASSFNFTIMESKSPGTVIDVIKASDPDTGSSGEISFSIVSGNTDGVFDLDDSTGELILVKPVNFESMVNGNYFRLVVRAQDNSLDPKSTTAVVFVIVKNVVEAPRWPLPLPTVYLTEANKCRSKVNAFSREVTALSSSGDEDVEYSLVNQTNFFWINNTTGVLDSNSTLTQGTYELILRACSKGTTVCSDATLTVIVLSARDIIFCPAFYTANILENVTVDTVVEDFNTTKDESAEVSFTITRGNGDSKFRIDQQTGILYLASKLDREKTPRYSLLITAEDTAGSTAQAQIVINVMDVQDSPPAFASQTYQGEITETDTPGTGIRIRGSKIPLTLKVVDPDLNTKLTFSILDRLTAPKELIRIDNSGHLFLNKSVDFEKIMNPRFTLKVMASDGMFSATTDVTITVIDANDNLPYFEDPDDLMLNVSEGGDVPRDLVSIKASDNDTVDTGKLDFSLVLVESSNDSSTNATLNPFSIDPKTGEMRLKQKLDRETVEWYFLNVTVVDSDLTHKVTKGVNVTVLDVNDNWPIFGSDSYCMNITEEGLCNIEWTKMQMERERLLLEMERLKIEKERLKTDQARLEFEKERLKLAKLILL